MRSEPRAMRSRALVFAALAALSGAGRLSAQQPPPVHVEATRPELEAIAAHPPKGTTAADLAAVQARLATGDFAVGDKVTIDVQGETGMSNTYTVGGGRTIQIPTLPPLSLSGVLRSESDSVIREFIGRYIRDPQVTVTPLMRLGILGGVAKPGYYDVNSESLLSEVVMAAGGLAPVGDMKRTQVYRGNTVVLDSKATSVAISKGSTLDLLNLQSGDNVQVGVANPNATLTKVQIITAILAIPVMILTISALSGK
jgi:protein involved in polysaccharide export with SLBB domain